MTPRFTRSLALALTFAVTTPALAEDAPTAQTVIATVNGQEIKLGHMVLLRQSLPEQYSQLPNDVLFDGLLDQLIQQAALEGAYDGETPDRVKLALENQTRTLLAAEEVGEILKTAVSEEAIEAAYNEAYSDAEPEPEYKAAHILVETEDEAKAIIEELAGGADFAELAKEKSTGPSGPTGGELGWFSKGMMVGPFEEAVKDMEPGAISDPVETQFGWHVIKLNETREKEAPSLESVRNELKAKVEQDVVKAHVDALVEDATVDKTVAESIDPALLSNTELLE